MGLEGRGLKISTEVPALLLKTVELGATNGWLVWSPLSELG